MKEVVKKEDYPRLAREILRRLTPGRRATVLGLRGDLGAGKTTFTQVLAQELGVEESVTSPTFVIEKIYPLATGYHFRRLIHLDAYRLATPTELEPLGWSGQLADRDNLIVIEWPERLAALLPPETLIINFKPIKNDTREVEYESV